MSSSIYVFTNHRRKSPSLSSLLLLLYLLIVEALSPGNYSTVTSFTRDSLTNGYFVSSGMCHPGVLVEYSVIGCEERLISPENRRIRRRIFSDRHVVLDICYSRNSSEISGYKPK